MEISQRLECGKMSCKGERMGREGRGGGGEGQGEGVRDRGRERESTAFAAGKFLKLQHSLLELPTALRRRWTSMAVA